MRLGKYAVAYDLFFPLLTYGTDDYKATPTLAAGDIQVDIDGAGFNNVAVLGAETAASSKLVKQSLSIAEMTGKKITVRVVDQTATKEWSDDMYVIYTYGHANAQLVFDFGTSTVLLGTDGLSAAALSTAALNKMVKARGGKVIVSADGLQSKIYDTSGVLVVTLDRTGAGPYTWTPTFA